MCVASSPEMPVQLTFHGLHPSVSLSDYVQKKAEKLSKLNERITHVRVALEAPHRHQRTGKAFRVRIDIGIPREDIVIDRHHKGSGQADAYAAIDIAFEDAARVLRDGSRVARGDVKRHEEHSHHGVVFKLFSYEGYGFIRTEEGRDVYFHRNAVENGGFERMRRGSRVRFTESEESDGGHASHVVLLRGGRRAQNDIERI